MESYEKALAELRDIVNRLEGGELTLQESLELFEKGIERIRFCRKKLEEVRKKVEVLVEEAGGGLRREEFEPDE